MAPERELGTNQEATAVFKVRDDGKINQGGERQNEENQTDVSYILDEELTGLTNRLG